MLSETQKKAVDSIIDTNLEQEKEVIKTHKSRVKKEIINNVDGLVEKVEKNYVTNDGRNLLKG